MSWGLTAAPVASVQAAATPTTDLPVQDDHPWYWEGNVQARIVAYLATQGYSIRSVADTAARTRGKDIVAVAPGGEELWVSVKGYPENSPGVQARHWFAGAIFDLVLYRNESPAASLALGLPDGFSSYLNLAPRTSWLMRTTPFAIYWVDKTGAVRAEH